MLVYASFIVLTFGGFVCGNEPSKCNHPDHTCPENEHYTQDNPRCIRTCANKWVPISRDCKPITGCVCNVDFVRLNDDGSGPCIPENECPHECKDPNAIFKKCPNPCPVSCDHPFPKICTRACIESGHECAPGFILNNNGKYRKCIRPRDCPKPISCPKHSRYVVNDNQCPKTCGNRLLPNSDVAGACAPFTGCACKPGYVRPYDNATGPCIKETKCPPIPTECGINEVPTSCAIVCPPQTCDSIFSKYYCLPTECRPGCDCQNSYLRNKHGVCIPSDDCFKSYPPLACNGDFNATLTTCPNPCPKTCDDPDAGDGRCLKMCLETGCQCNEGYLLTEIGGICIKPEDCESCKGDQNAVYSDCPSACEPTCENPDRNQVCTRQCMPPGCICKKDFVKNQKTGKCIKVESCPGCNGDLNATHCDCPSFCPVTCENRHSKEKVLCPALCDPSGCVCNEGYILTKKGGLCVKPEDCPAEPQCDGDRNATYKESSSYCQATCKNPDPEGQCLDMPTLPGCVCNQGFIKAKACGKCIKPEDCPGGWPTCRENETYVSCKVDCPTNYCPVDDNPAIIVCDPMYPCPGGCACRRGYLMVSKDDDRCIRSSECPPVTCTGPNQVWDPYAPGCLHESCDDRNIPCDFQYPGPPRCRCKPGYYKNKDGICVPECECPKSEPTCGYNEVAVPCRQICPPQNCEIAYTDYACTEEHKICEPGCDCRPDHLRNGSGICIPNEQCPYPSTPVCGINEIARDCKRICPPQTCLSKYALFRCVADLPCTPGCDCVPDYLRDENGICIPSGKCPAPHSIPDECKRTCAEPNPPNCSYNPPKENINGYDCAEGYILLKLGGECIPIDQCPPDIACHGDANARPKRCPNACPSTCEAPNEIACKRMCEPIACACKPGYIKSNKTETARCIVPDQCPGGNPCDKNEHFVDCKTNCPNDYCPVDDSRDLVLCDPPAEHCLSGCICNLNHKRKSRDDPRCIVSSKCPPVKCTRGNETWSSCPPACLAENCEDVNNQPTVCNTLILNCEPRCICEKKYFRNSSGICVRAKDCQTVCEDPHAVFKDCPSACEPTCTNPEPKICTEQCMPPGCVCEEGYVFNEKDGKCIEKCNCPGR